MVLFDVGGEQVVVVIIFEVEATVFLKEIHCEPELFDDFCLKLVIQQPMLYNKLPPFNSLFEPPIIFLNDPNLKLNFLLIISIIEL